MLSQIAFGRPSSSPSEISLSGGTAKAAANIGCVVGQLGFGAAGDIFGRKAVYGKEMMIVIVSTILLIRCVPSLSLFNLTPSQPPFCRRARL